MYHLADVWLHGEFGQVVSERRESADAVDRFNV
jgi:hypothetical protein